MEIKFQYGGVHQIDSSDLLDAIAASIEKYARGELLFTPYAIYGGVASGGTGCYYYSEELVWVTPMGAVCKNFGGKWLLDGKVVKPQLSALTRYVSTIVRPHVDNREAAISMLRGLHNSLMTIVKLSPTPVLELQDKVTATYITSAKVYARWLVENDAPFSVMVDGYTLDVAQHWARCKDAFILFWLLRTESRLKGGKYSKLLESVLEDSRPSVEGARTLSVFHNDWAYVVDEQQFAFNVKAAVGTGVCPITIENNGVTDNG